MKKLLIACLTFVLLTSLCACGTDDKTDEVLATPLNPISSLDSDELVETKVIDLNDKDARNDIDDDMFLTFEYLRGGPGYEYYRDVVTDAMFIYHDDGYDGGMSPMWDPTTGLPLTYARYCEMYAAMIADNAG